MHATCPAYLILLDLIILIIQNNRKNYTDRGLVGRYTAITQRPTIE
jgi:hypothetical protein